MYSAWEAMLRAHLVRQCGRHDEHQTTASVFSCAPMVFLSFIVLVAAWPQAVVSPGGVGFGELSIRERAFELQCHCKAVSCLLHWRAPFAHLLQGACSNPPMNAKNQLQRAPDAARLVNTTTHLLIHNPPDLTHIRRHQLRRAAHPHQPH